MTQDDGGQWGFLGPAASRRVTSGDVNRPGGDSIKPLGLGHSSPKKTIL